jgi:hypothetical protein
MMDVVAHEPVSDRSLRGNRLDGRMAAKTGKDSIETGI